MTKRIYLSLILIFLSLSCKEMTEPLNNEDDKTRTIIHLQLPKDYQEALDPLRIDFRNRYTNELHQFAIKGSQLEVELPQGLYNINVVNQDQEPKNIYQGGVDDVSIIGSEVNLKVKVFGAYFSDSWLISELHYTANETEHGLPYFQDGYIELHNNTDHLLYADGLCFSRAYMLTNEEYNIWKGHKGVVVPFFIEQVPGNGVQYPVPAGGKLLIAISAINHHLVNPASRYDLSKADFEMYSENSLSGIDNPDVPNMNLHYIEISYSPMLMSPCEAYFIFKPPHGEKLSDYLKGKEVAERENNGEFVYSYGIPEQDIIDAVHIGETKDIMTQSIFPAYIDAGFTYCTIGKYNFTSRRKVLRMDGKRAVLQDTNNSTNDFLPNTLSRYLIKN